MITTIITVFISLIIGVVIGVLVSMLIGKHLSKAYSDNPDLDSIKTDLAQLAQSLCLEKPYQNTKYERFKIIEDIHILLDEVNVKLNEKNSMTDVVHASIQNSRETFVNKQLPRTSRKQLMNQPLTAAPIEEEPTPQIQQPQTVIVSQSDGLKMEKVFEEVKHLQEENAPIYRNYNERMKKLEYTSSTSADYIVKENGDEMFVLPNQSTSFHPKYISNDLYQCNVSYINSDCTMKMVCKANKYGEIIRIGEII